MNTVNGADASAFYYSLIETAKANGINPYDYIWYVLEQGPACSKTGDWDALLPWNYDSSFMRALKATRDSATPDPLRDKPYVLRGSR